MQNPKGKWRFWLALAFVASPLWVGALVFAWFVIAKPPLYTCHGQVGGTELCFED